MSKKDDVIKYYTIPEFARLNQKNGWPSMGTLYQMSQKWSDGGRKGKHFVCLYGGRILVDPVEFYKWLEEGGHYIKTWRKKK